MGGNVKDGASPEGFEEHVGVIEALKDTYTSAEDDVQVIQAIHDAYDQVKEVVSQERRG